jgi:hypothetical protein
MKRWLNFSMYKYEEQDKKLFLAWIHLKEAFLDWMKNMRIHPSDVEYTKDCIKEDYKTLKEVYESETE